MPDTIKSAPSFKISLRARITLSAGVPSTEYAVTPSTGAFISNILNGWRNVTEVPAPLWSLSGATTVTSAISFNSFTSAQRPSAYTPSSLLTSIFKISPKNHLSLSHRAGRGQTHSIRGRVTVSWWLPVLLFTLYHAIYAIAVVLTAALTV